MQLNKAIFRELIKQGYSVKRKRRVWDLSDGKLWCLTPELVKGYKAFTQYTPYKYNVVEAEREILKSSASSIFANLNALKANIIDFGCGDGTKANLFVSKLPSSVIIRYYPVDVSNLLLYEAVQRMKQAKSKKIALIKPFHTDFMEATDIGGMVRNAEFQRNLLFLLGGTVSHVDINDLLFTLSKNMFHGDLFVMGIGLRKGRRFVLLDKYRAPVLRKWFIHTMQGIGFAEHEVEYDARFAHSRLELFYRVLVDKKIRHEGKTIYFRKGDEVLVAVQYKFYTREVKKYCAMYFSNVELLTSANGEYCLAVCRK